MAQAAQALFGDSGDMLTACLQNPALDYPRELHLDHASLYVPALGILVIIPDKSSEQGLILSSGIHGNETAPIEILNRLVHDIIMGDLQPRRPCMLIMGHPEAMRREQRFVSVNMNRLFLETHRQEAFRDTSDANRARVLEATVGNFAQEHKIAEHYDLHTAIRPSLVERFALYPFRPDRKNTPNPAQLKRLQQMGISAVVHQNHPSTTFSAYTARTFGTESYTVELGKVQPFGNNDLATFEDAYVTLRSCLTNATTPSSSEELTHYVVTHEIIHRGDGFSLCIPDNAANFTAYKRGDLIWHTTTERYVVEAQEELILFPNPEVPAGQRAGLMIKPVCQKALHFKYF